MTELFLQRGHQFQIGLHKPLLEALRQKPYTLFDSHWFEVIRMLFNEEVVNMTANDDGMPNEVWF